MSDPVYNDQNQQLGSASKVVAGLGAGVGLGGPLVQILAWVLSLSQIEMPVYVQLAIANVLSAVIAVAAAHFMPPNVVAPPKGPIEP